MRVILFFDQIQAGLGGKERSDTPLGLEKGGIGSYLMFKDYLQAQSVQVIATVYCGTTYFKENRAEVIEKIGRLITKTKAEAILCGPCFNYADYIEMACEVGVAVHSETCHAYVACANEVPELIARYCNQLSMIRMPKKGGTGLSQALQQMAQIIGTQDLTSDAIYR